MTEGHWIHRGIDISIVVICGNECSMLVQGLNPQSGFTLGSRSHYKHIYRYSHDVMN